MFTIIVDRTLLAASNQNEMQQTQLTTNFSNGKPSLKGI